YTSPSKHPADSNIRDIYHPLFDKYKVDVVFNSDNHNYQRTFPLKYNNGDSSNPIVTNKNKNSYDSYTGVIYLITGTAGRSHYEFEGQASYIVKQNSNNFGFVNIDINGKTLKGTFYANEQGSGHNTESENKMLEEFTISKEKLSK
ncbi:MAG TPA: hypothetical protein VFK40_13695, partial [Nitrososphaeraceae archaeon]|nr:hypothetical protein [Nitrososphaeraceae archaeon]